MEFWFSARYLFNSSNPNRIVPSDTLYTRYDNHLLISHTYLLRYKLWVNYPIHNANEASIFFICLFIHVGCGLYCGSYNVLETWNIGVILLYRHSHSTYRLRTALRTNIILRSKQQQWLISFQQSHMFVQTLSESEWIFSS